MAMTQSVWGTTIELSAMETVMWRADVHPMARSTVLAVELLDAEPDWDRLVEAHDWAGRMVPRFRDRVRDPLPPLTAPVWERDPGFDLRYHLRRLRLVEPSHEALLELAAQLAMTPFDRARPPWEAVLVPGLPDGRAAYLLKLHHALTDGMGLAQLLSLVHSRQRDHTPDKPEPSAASVAAVPAPEPLSSLVTGQLRRDLAGTGRLLRRVGADVATGLRAPRDTARDLAAYVGSARRVLSPPDAPGLPLLAGRTGSWRFVALDVELGDLKAASKAVGGTVNDGFLAGLLGGFRLYHERLGSPLDDDALMPVSAPVSVRRSEDQGGGNRFAPARLAGPVGCADPARRIVAVGDQMRAARAEPALESAELVTPLLARLPGPVVGELGARQMAASDLQASNVPGLREDVYLAGARIERIYGFAPLPGCAAMIAANSHGPTLCIGANVDAGAITDVRTFGECLAEGFAEVLGLAPGVPKPPRVIG